MSALRPNNALRRLFRSTQGGAAVEFAVLSPILCLVLAAAADFGGLVYTRFQVENAVSAAANLAIVGEDQVNASGGPALAGQIAAFLGTQAGIETSAVLVNSGPLAVFASNAVAVTGASAAADACYCPSVDGGVAWGASVSCGSACVGGGAAGKFVEVTAERAYTPLLSQYGLLQDGKIVVSALVQVQ